MEIDDTICYCFHVSKRKIINYIRIHQPRVASQVSECGGAGTGCGWCIPFLKKYFREISAGQATEETLSAEEYARQRGEYISRGEGVPPPGAIPPPNDNGSEGSVENSPSS